MLLDVSACFVPKTNVSRVLRRTELALSSADLIMQKGDGGPGRGRSPSVIGTGTTAGRELSGDFLLASEGL